MVVSAYPGFVVLHLKVQPKKYNMLCHLMVFGNFQGSETRNGIFGGLIFGPGIFVGFVGSPRDFLEF